MEESKEQQSQHRFLQAAIYLSVALEIFCFICAPQLLINRSLKGMAFFIERMHRLKVYQQPLYSKLFTLILICLVSIGTLSKKQMDFNPKNSVGYPLVSGLLLFFGCLWFYGHHGSPVLYGLNWYQIAYIVFAFAGTVLIHVSMDNVSKMISARLGKDRWNVEEESFMQRTAPLVATNASISQPCFISKKKFIRGILF